MKAAGEKKRQDATIHSRARAKTRGLSRKQVSVCPVEVKGEEQTVVLCFSVLPDSSESEREE
ncbi:hypothetical protein E2C01_013457 [Portunus trituberculatus]|uniref:Uncharacterized protein n=1 Tax=Portunus trituberculatus TaxID=210409 RepID=A0A5B7DGP1_PORTR|nr:hypothetical protein [Portunus trituberculatus]